MGYAEKRGTCWRGRYKIGPGRYGTVVDATGATTRFTTKRDAQNAANAAEAQIWAGTLRDPAAGRITFGEYACRWYQAQDLAASTMQNYRRHIEEHLLPAFEDTPISDILATDIAAWEKRELAVPYAPSSVKTWRGTLHLILADAVEEGLRDSNPATRRRGRGKRAGRSRHRGPEKSVTDALGMLLIAERAALLSGRDDEFLAVTLLGYTGIRWGELVGLETKYARDTQLRVEWQLYELDNGRLERCPPKDDSRRTIDLPDWLTQLLAKHISRTDPKPCACHGQRYVFHGHGAANGAARQQGAKLVDVARRAGVSTGPVSNVLNRPESVPEPTRVKVALAIEELGYVRGGALRELAAHWRRTGFAAWLFHPAATGWYPRRSPGEAHPVPLLGDPWPGILVRGRNASRRAEACWLPIAPGLTPHGARSEVDALIEYLAARARLDGASWTQVGAQLGVSKQAAQQRYTTAADALLRTAIRAGARQAPLTAGPQPPGEVCGRWCINGNGSGSDHTSGGSAHVKGGHCYCLCHDHTACGHRDDDDRYGLIRVQTHPEYFHHGAREAIQDHADDPADRCEDPAVDPTDTAPGVRA